MKSQIYDKLTRIEREIWKLRLALLKLEKVVINKDI